MRSNDSKANCSAAPSAVDDQHKQTLDSRKAEFHADMNPVDNDVRGGIEDDSVVVVVVTPPAQPADPPKTPSLLNLTVDKNPSGSVVDGNVECTEDELVARNAEDNADPTIPPPTGWMEWSWVEVSRGDVWGASGAGLGVAPGAAAHGGGSTTARFGPVGRVGGARSIDVISLSSDRATTPFSAIGVDDESVTASREVDLARSASAKEDYHASDTMSTSHTSHHHISTLDSPYLHPLPPLRHPSPHTLHKNTHAPTHINPPTPPPILSVFPQKSIPPSSQPPTSITPPPRSSTPTHIANLLARMEIAAAAAASAQTPIPTGASATAVCMQRVGSGSDSGTGSGSEASLARKRNPKGRKRRQGNTNAVAGSKGMNDDGTGGRKMRAIWRVWWDGVTMWGVQIIKGEGDWQWAVVKLFGAVVAAGVGGYVLIRLGSSCQKRLTFLFGSDGLNGQH